MPKKGRKATRTTPGFTGPFKGNPQQGTLMDVRTLPKTGEEIGPRGYSLNRSRQFNDIIQSRVGFTKKPGQVSLHVKHAEGGPAVPPDMHPYGPTGLGENAEARRGSFGRLAASMGRGRSKLVDTLARSTVDPEHLKSLGEISMEPQHPDRSGSYRGGEYNRINLHVTHSSMEGLGGSYKDPEPWKHEDAPPRTKQPQQRGPVDPDAEMTMLHEIGHHASALAGTNRYGTPSEQGREEGRADRYMMGTYREDPRNPTWRGRTDPRTHSYLARGMTQERFGSSGAIDYASELGMENRPPRSHMLNVMTGAGAETERTHRPMLDEFLPEHQQVFSTGTEGWARRGDEPEELRTGTYNKAAQLTNMRRSRAEEAGGGGRAEVKRRWGVDRNLGRQF